MQIAGTGGVPTDGVAAVVMNVTATDPTAATFVTIWPAGIARPPNSNLNVTPGVTVPNLVTVALGAGGRVSAFNLAGTTHVIFDVVGYYADQRGPFGSRFHGVDPFRLFDTRAGSGSVPTVALNAGGILSIDVRGRGSIPASGVTGLVMNVTVTEPDASSYLTVFPGDVTMPTTSNLNFGPRQTVPNLVTIRVPASGVLRFYNFAGTTHVLADVVGYYDENRSGNTGRFVALTPSRLADTRAGNGALGPRDWGILQVAGRGGLPTTGVGSVVLNTTVTEPTASGFLTIFPDDLCKVPLASNLNFVPGLTVPNLVIVRISTMTDCAVEAGAVDFFNSAGSTHVVVDLFGYFAA